VISLRSLVRGSVLLLAALLLLAACADGPRQVQVGAEECAHCRMLVSENRFASQLVTDRGRQYVFDSIECMAEFLDEGAEVSEERVGSLWVTDFTRPGEWLEAGQAHFLRSDELRSPMGMGLSAFADEAAAREHQAEHGGEILAWTEVRSLVAEVDVVNGQGHRHGGHDGR